ncbi:MAG TPA: EmrA/EmrK family multidrug efflux transporter periplasmic adaptor subunit, partial [Rhodanobacteraceae bacterium]
MTSPINPNPVNEDDPALQLKHERLAKRRRLLRIVAAVIVIVAIVWSLYYFLDARWYESTDDAYVNGNIVEVTPRVPGTVVSIGADD